MKRVLIISYHFPPDSEVGGLRAQKYAKYLPLYGWTPVVLSVIPKYYPVLDLERSKDIKCSVNRTHVLPGIRNTYLALKQLLTFRKQDKINPDRNQECIRHLRDRKLRGLKRYALYFTWFPDDKTNWIIPALIKAVYLVWRHEIDTIMTTSPPHSVQITGLILKKTIRKRWVIDFRDPWAMEQKEMPKIFARANKWLERISVRNADIVVTATESVRQYLIKTNPAAIPEKVVCIPNGYDLEDFQKRLDKRTDHIIMSYIGEFYFGRSPRVFLKAVSELLEMGLIDRKKIRLRFIGKVSHIDGYYYLDDLAKELHLSDIVEIRDYVPYREAVHNILSSDLLIVISPQNFMEPMKVFEYMASGAYVLAFTPPGALADIVNQYAKGFVVGLNDLEKTKECILTCCRALSNRMETEKRAEPDDYVLSFERKALTKRLTQYL